MRNTRVLLIALTFIIIRQLSASIPEELGKVIWLRDLGTALLEASKKQKPVLILFQEVPGCSTCKNYGREVLSHPLIVETIETYFVPLVIYNNRGGDDAAALRLFGEPSWNNPVLRMVSFDRKEILPRLNGNYTASGLVEYLIQGLRKSGFKVPAYLSLLNDELRAEEKGLSKVTLGMYCFWTGEKVYGKIDGVFKTEAGFMNGYEVVNIYFDPSTVSLGNLIDKGQTSATADVAFMGETNQIEEIKKQEPGIPVKSPGVFRLDKEPKYFLRQTAYRSLPMTEMQATRINSLLGEGRDPGYLLSPRQLVMLKALSLSNSVTWKSSPHDSTWQEKMYMAWTELKLPRSSGV